MRLTVQGFLQNVHGRATREREKFFEQKKFFLGKNSPNVYHASFGLYSMWRQVENPYALRIKIQFLCKGNGLEWDWNW